MDTGVDTDMAVAEGIRSLSGTLAGEDIRPADMAAVTISSQTGSLAGADMDTGVDTDMAVAEGIRSLSGTLAGEDIRPADTAAVTISSQTGSLAGEDMDSTSAMAG